MSFYTKIISNLVFPLHERLKGHDSVALKNRLELSQWWPREKLRGYQIKRLKEFLVKAQKDVPYYHQIFSDSGVEPRDFSSISDLQRLPLLTKATIRSNVHTLKAETAKKLIRYNTGGSSGEPLVFYIGMDRVSHDVASKWRATRWWNVDIGDIEIVVWGSPIELGAQDKIRVFRDRILRSTLFPAFEMSDQTLAKFIRLARTKRPTMLFGYPSALAHIARYARDGGMSLGELGIKVAFVTSEVLYPYQRDEIESVFNCPVANGYGGRDAGFIAHECPKQNMHISAEDIIIETVDGNDQPCRLGQAGEVVVTHLATQDFPFIRYKTGDVAVIVDDGCTCGRTLPVLKEIKGRTTDFLVDQNGTIVHGLALIYIMRDISEIENFKIVQQSVRELEVFIVAKKDKLQDTSKMITRAMKSRMGEGVEVIVKLVDRIEPEPSGKYRYVQSKVNVS